VSEIAEAIAFFLALPALEFRRSCKLIP
jgi:hypothetical protein